MEAIEIHIEASSIFCLGWIKECNETKRLNANKTKILDKTTEKSNNVSGINIRKSVKNTMA